MRVISWTRVLALFVGFSLFARCAGGDLPDVVHDVAHVLGTPGAAS